MCFERLEPEAKQEIFANFEELSHKSHHSEKQNLAQAEQTDQEN